MIAILMSINPYWLVKILNGEKKLEIRKTIPNAKFPIDVYLYCTKGDVKGAKKTMTIPQLKMLGRVVAKFTLNKVNKYEIQMPLYDQHSIYKNGEYNGELETSKNDLVDIACLTPKEVGDYIDENFDIPLYGWYIENLVIFEEAMWLHDFKTRYYPQYVGMVKNKTHYELLELKKPPISWQFVEIEE